LLFVLRRTLAVVPVIAMVAVIVYAIVRMTPGDPDAIIAGDTATAEQLEQIRRSMGLDQTIPCQLVIGVGQLLRGVLGVSLLSGTPVADMILQRMGPSLALALSTITLSVLVAVPLGILAAWRQGRLLDRAVMAFSVLGFSIPVFVVGYVL